MKSYCRTLVHYADFINLEQEEIFELILLAQQFKSLKKLLVIRDLIKTVEEIKLNYNIVNDFTPEEEAQIIEENKWCQEEGEEDEEDKEDEADEEYFG